MNEPIIIEKYSPKWSELFQEEKDSILESLGELAIQIEHIGSTAVPGLGAKPIIDIMVGIKSLAEESNKCIKLLEKIDYFINENFIEKSPQRRSLAKTLEGVKFHLYIIEVSTDFWDGHILFRDYLRNHPNVAKEYNELKIQLAENYRLDKQAYNAGKTSYIKKIEKKARDEKTRYTS